VSGIEYELAGLLKKKGLTLGTVESATGGLIAHLVTNVPGSSDYFKGSVTAYANETKINIAGVKPATLKEHGAVSPQTAEEMAAGGREVLKVDICVSDTGIAGPSGATPGKPVGLFYIGLAHKNGVFSRKLQLKGTREAIKSSAAQAALEWVREYLERY